MAKGAYVGINSTAAKIKKIYVGVNGIAQEVKKAYVGINSVAQLWWSGVNNLFYENGNQQTSVTGGWTTSGWTYGGVVITGASIKETYMQVTGGYENRVTLGSIVGTVNKINVDNLKYINADIEIVTNGIVEFSLCSGTNAQAAVVNSQIINIGTYTKSLDVSTLTGDYYIVFSAVGSYASGFNPNAKITKVWAG